MLSGWPGACLAAVTAGGSVALTEDDVYRGISETCGHPAAQVDLHLRAQGAFSSAAFAGVWASGGLSRSRCGSAKELNAYGGYTVAITAAVIATLTYTRFAFPGGDYNDPYLYGLRYDYDQFGMSWSLAERLDVTLAWTPDAPRYERYAGSRSSEQVGHAFAYGLEWRQPLALWLSLDAGAGYDRMADPLGTGYGFWSVGLSHASGPLELDFAYFRTAKRAVRLFGPDAAGGRVSATLLWRF